MPIKSFVNGDAAYLVTCPVCNPEIPDVPMYEPRVFIPVSYRLFRVEVAPEVDFGTQIVAVILRCENGHLWQFSLQAGQNGNVILEDVIEED
jgi:hypothetical protein